MTSMNRKNIVLEKSISLDQLRQVLFYNKETGLFTWLVSTNCKIVIGSHAGSVDSKGYMRVRFNGFTYRYHRLVWFWCNGVWPEYEIDHIDRNKLNNKIENLRDVSRNENAQNLGMKARKTNKLGIVGVGIKGNRFTARIGVDGKYKHLGMFDSIEEASKAYLEAKKKYHPGSIQRIR